MLTRYRFDKVKERAKLKQSVARLVCILFPELEKLVSSLHTAAVYALLEELPGAWQIAKANLTHLKTLLSNASRGRYGRDMAVAIRAAARNSVGSRMPAKSLELQHTIRLIRELDAEVAEIEDSIDTLMDELHSPITTIPGIGTRMGAMILAEVETSPALILLTSCWPTQGCPPRLTSPGSSKTATHTWRNEAPDTCATPSTVTSNTN